MGELTNEQVDLIFEKLKVGNHLINENAEHVLGEFSLCDALDSVVEHLETAQMEIALGLHTDDGRDPNNLTHMAMHWGVILGAGIALSIIDHLMDNIVDDDPH